MGPTSGLSIVSVSFVSLCQFVLSAYPTRHALIDILIHGRSDCRSCSGWLAGCVDALQIMIAAGMLLELWMEDG
jgi:hypothetical protein